MINTGEIIIGAFLSWYKSGKLSGEQIKLLTDRTNFSTYGKAADFFQDYGFLDSKGDTTDLGKQTLMNAPDEAPGLDNLEAAEADAPNCGDTSDRITDDRSDPKLEPARITAEFWKENGFYAVTIVSDAGDASRASYTTFKGYDNYIAGRDYLHKCGYCIKKEAFQTEAQYFPGLLTYEDAVNVFKTADERYLEFKSFPQFSKTAKIRVHDFIVLAADTGVGKSNLAINFLNDLNGDYPVLYFDLEMDSLTILQRLVAIQTGIELDRIEGYQKDPHTEAAVNSALRAITSRKPLQILNDVYALEEIEAIIKKTTKDREEPTIVIIDHGGLLEIEKRLDGYEKFTYIAKHLRRISRKNNIILLTLLQQNRGSKTNQDGTPKRPTNGSLKDSGEWENSSVKVIFLWKNPKLKKNQQELLITKNRKGRSGAFTLNCFYESGTYTEAKEQPQGGGASFDLHNLTPDPTGKQTKRDKRKEKLQTAYADVVAKTGEGNVTLKDLADAMDVTTATVKRYLKEYGGFTLDGEAVDPAGIDTIVENTGFIRLTPGEAKESSMAFDEPDDVIG